MLWARAARAATTAKQARLPDVLAGKLSWHFGSASLRLLSDFLFLRMCACYYIPLALVSSWSCNASITTGVQFYESLRIAISSEVQIEVFCWEIGI